MFELIRIATADVTFFLETNLPNLSDDWWNKHVLGRLSFHQQRTAQDRGFSSLSELDFSALLRILDQNWYELGSNLKLPREARS